MKFALALLALAVLASVDAAPWSATEFYTGTLDDAQGAIEDIGKADARLASKEGQLETLVAGATSLFEAETILEAATDATAYTQGWVGVTTAD